MNRSLLIAIAAAVLLVLVLFWTRFQVIPANYAYAPAFYKINRLSGEVTLTVGKEFVIVEGIDTKKSEQPPVPAPAPAPKIPAPAPESSAK
ncbi:MAG: hypothetical protein PHG91_02905 [Syntrophales bacterium]|nr:hypothetical protein [Syntrophales bacterium]HPL62565.1 hypothetical protein [Syntrophales bacterium]